MYNEKVFEHYRNPRNVGEIEDADGIGVYMSDFCGDITKFWIKVAEGKIVEAKYKTQGCVASVACGSVLTELVRNKTVEEALRITKEDVLDALGGLPEPKIHCSMLALDSLSDAVLDYLLKKGVSAPDTLVEKRERIKPLLVEMEKKGYVLI
ncbi:iron-sulfur cluster assembly scaffold protein [Candidatus Bathyarchaeota archaeon]|nr:iron-sulfur cluster assembly scaffold protein [Candidatus Bathyarchaeota archaeon]